MINLVIGLWAAAMAVLQWNAPESALWCGINLVVAIWCLTDVVRDLR